MLSFRPDAPVRWTHDGTTLLFRDIGEHEVVRFAQLHSVITDEHYALARDLVLQRYGEISSQEDAEKLVRKHLRDVLSPAERVEAVSFDEKFFAANWIGAEGMDPDGVQFSGMTEEMKREVYRDLAEVPEWPPFWSTYLRGKKKLGSIVASPATTSDGAPENAPAV